MEDRKIIVLELSDIKQFEATCNRLIADGFKVASQACWFGGSERDGFGAMYQAILAKPESLADSHKQN